MSPSHSITRRGGTAAGSSGQVVWCRPRGVFVPDGGRAEVGDLETAATSGGGINAITGVAVFVGDLTESR